MKLILWIGLAICFIYGFYWKGMYENGFFVFQSVSFLLLSLYLFSKDTNSFICFLWVSYSFNNFIDEIFGIPTRIDIGEKIIIVITPVIWILIKIWQNDGKNNRK